MLCAANNLQALVVQTESLGSTMSGPTTPEQTRGLNSNALVIFRQHERDMLLPWSAMSCMFSVDARKKAMTSVIWLHSGYHLEDGIPFKTWAHLHRLVQDTA